MTYRRITTKNHMIYDIKFSHIVAALLCIIDKIHAARMYLYMYSKKTSVMCISMEWRRTQCTPDKAEVTMYLNLSSFCFHPCIVPVGMVWDPREYGMYILCGHSIHPPGLLTEWGEGWNPPHPRNLEIEYGYYCFVTGIKQQSCPRLRQKQSERI